MVQHQLVTTNPIGILFLKYNRTHRVIKTRSLTSEEVSSNSHDQMQDELDCCISENFSVYSFVDLFVNITSSFIINITDDMLLCSVIQLAHLKNITIIGYNNPTVQCGYSGGLQFVSYHNVTIEGITWNGCSTKENGNTTLGIALYVYNSSHISFESCIFWNLLGQSVVISHISGSVNINNCKFTHNNNYNNHGTAIHYSSNDDAQLVFMINNCTFDYSEGASIVYLYQSGILQKNLILQNVKFNNNQGVPLYILNQKLDINGLVLFEENTAASGGGLFVSDFTSVIFNENSIVMFGKIQQAIKVVLSFYATTLCYHLNTTRV